MLWDSDFFFNFIFQYQTSKIISLSRSIYEKINPDKDVYDNHKLKCKST